MAKLQNSTIIKSIFSPLLLLALVFLPTGNWNYWQGWVYVISCVVVLLATVIVLRKDQELIQERLSPGKGMKWWDKVYFALSTPLTFLSTILAALYVGRWHIFTINNQVVYLIGVVVFLLGHALFLWAKHENRYFSSVVRIQTDRGQQVCDSGPYRFVRHPGYVAGILFGMATPILLGSSYWLVYLLAALASLTLIIRTGLEDKTLRNELPGYAVYAQKVKYRLVPYIW